MDGLYALKPWYAGRLAGLRAHLVARHVSPNLISAAGVIAGAGAGLALATGAGLRGTRSVLPPHGRLHRAHVTVVIGDPLREPTAAQARAAVLLTRRETQMSEIAVALAAGVLVAVVSALSPPSRSADPTIEEQSCP